MTGLTSEGTYLQGLPFQLQDEITVTAQQNLKSLCHIFSPHDSNDSLLSQGCTHPSKRLPLWEQETERTFQGQGRGRGASNCPVPTCKLTGSHVLSITSFTCVKLLSVKVTLFVTLICIFCRNGAPHYIFWVILFTFMNRLLLIQHFLVASLELSIVITF